MLNEIAETTSNLATMKQFITYWKIISNISRCIFLQSFHIMCEHLHSILLHLITSIVVVNGVTVMDSIFMRLHYGKVTQSYIKSLMGWAWEMALALEGWILHPFHKACWVQRVQNPSEWLCICQNYIKCSYFNPCNMFKINWLSTCNI